MLELRSKRGHKETTEQVHEGSVCLDPPFFAGGWQSRYGTSRTKAKNPIAGEETRPSRALAMLKS